MLRSELNSIVSGAGTITEFVEIAMNIQALNDKGISLQNMLPSACQEYRTLQVENLITS
jgi:hypothetical protein